MLVMFAGYDTSSSLLSLAFYSLAVDQDVQQKVFNEIEDVIGNKVVINFFIGLK